jgi:hypothetical protein
MEHEYGPNTDQVHRFLQLLDQLTPEEWGRVMQAWGGVDATALRTWPKPTWMGAWRAAEEAAGRAQLQDAVSRVARAAADVAGRSGGSADATSMAAMALVVRPMISPPTFAILYEAFAGVIPVEKLD